MGFFGGSNPRNLGFLGINPWNLGNLGLKPWNLGAKSQFWGFFWAKSLGFGGFFGINPRILEEFGNLNLGVDFLPLPPKIPGFFWDHFGIISPFPTQFALKEGQEFLGISGKFWEFQEKCGNSRKIWEFQEILGFGGAVMRIPQFEAAPGIFPRIFRIPKKKKKNPLPPPKFPEKLLEFRGKIP